MADSLSSKGARLLASISLRCGESFQLSLLVTNAPFPSRNSRVGSASRPGTGTLFDFMEGPIARKSTFLVLLPVIMIPAIITLSSVCTRKRDEILSNCAGDGVGLAVAVGLGVGLTVAVGVGLGLADGVGVGVGIGPTVVGCTDRSATNVPFG